jgi:TonB-linked SusC/RagA family outer membrane protein
MKKTTFNEDRGLQLLTKSLTKRLWLLQIFILLVCSIPIKTLANNSGVKDKLLTEPHELISAEFQQTITGTVSDVMGPIGGANILVKGTSKGTLTDLDGNYTIEVDGNNDVLVFSFLGYESQEIIVENQTVINVTMVERSSKLDEVVVVGYGTRKRGELTGAVSTVKAEEIVRTSSNNLSKSLSGRVPGLTVLDRGGYPGQQGVVDILIRGRSTLGNNQPLVVIDGVPGADFSFLAPDDIESFSVLKDAAAAIYGARAANGVILITTKRGKIGKPSVKVTHTNQVQAFTRTPQYMNSFQYTTYQNEVETRYGREQPYSDEDVINFRDSNDRVAYPDTDWHDLTLNEWSHQTRSGISFSGGTEAIRYFVNGDVLNQGGQYKSGDLKFRQYQLRSNLDIKINDWIDLGVDIYGASGKKIQPGASRNWIFRHFQLAFPTEVGQYPNGLYGVAAEDGANPGVMSSFQSGSVDERDSELRTRFNLDLDLDFITEGLGLNANTTIIQRNSDTKNFQRPWMVYGYNPTTDEYVPQVGFNFNNGKLFSVEESFSKYNEEYYNAQLNYDRTFNDVHTLRAFVAMEQTEWRTRAFSAYKRDLISGELPSLFSGSDDGQRSTGFEQERGRLNYFGSLGYNYKRKYLIDFTLRYDGSDNFPEGKRFGTFPGIQAAWVISEEPFLQESDFISHLKLRASWSKMGNDRIPGFGYLNTYGYGGILWPYGYHNYYIFGESPTQVNTFFNNNVANPNITWEEAISQNIGFEFGLFDGKLNGDFNYYWGTRSNILTQRNASIPDYTALQLPLENLGEVDNYGYEIVLSYADRVSKDFSYNIGGNFSNTKNEIVFLDEPADVPDWRTQEGRSLGSFYVYPTDGLYSTQAEVDADPAARAGTLPGDVKYLDTDGDGAITGNDIIRTNSSNVPEIIYAVKAGLKYKHFDFNVLFQGQTNAQILVSFTDEGNRPDILFNQRWTPENPNARYPRAFGTNDPFNTKSNAQQDNWLHDASFLRLKEMQIGYNFPKNLIKGVPDIRLFLRGSNIFTWDKLKGWNLDPEMPGYEGNSPNAYAPLKTWSIGANISL